MTLAPWWHWGGGCHGDSQPPSLVRRLFGRKSSRGANKSKKLPFFFLRKSCLFMQATISQQSCFSLWSHHHLGSVLKSESPTQSTWIGCTWISGAVCSMHRWLAMQLQREPLLPRKQQQQKGNIFSDNNPALLTTIKVKPPRHCTLCEGVENVPSRPVGKLCWGSCVATTWQTASGDVGPQQWQTYMFGTIEYER